MLSFVERLHEIRAQAHAAQHASGTGELPMNYVFEALMDLLTEAMVRFGEQAEYLEQIEDTMQEFIDEHEENFDHTDLEVQWLVESDGEWVPAPEDLEEAGDDGEADWSRPTPQEVDEEQLIG